MKLLISKDLNLLRGIFLMGEISKFLAVAYDFPPSPGFPRGGSVHTWWVQHCFDIFGKKGDTCYMILGDNPAGHCFVLRDLLLIFQISYFFK